METSCIRQTLLPDTSQLFADYLYNFDRVSQFYGHSFSEPSGLDASARSVQFPEARRKGIVDALREQNGDSPALRKLAEAGTVAVVTGQQVGLFSGPAYTIFKALTAVKLAEHLSEQGTPAVAVFWLATEDHDLAEVDHAWVFNEHATPAKLSITNAVTNGGPVGNVSPAEIPIAELRSALGNLPFAEEVVSEVADAYRPGVGLGAAFRALLEKVLRGRGLLFLDPLAPGVRDIAADFLAEAAGRVPELVKALRQRNGQLTEAGYHAQVHIDEDTSLLFLIGEHKRLPLRWREGRFSARDHSYGAAELKQEASRLSPNALLRPVMQDYLLPTAAYIGGPSEIAYMAQAQVLYEKLLGRMPVIFPRNTFTLLDGRATKLLRRYKLSVPQVLDHQEKVKSAMAARLIPADLSQEFARLRSEVGGALEKLESGLKSFDPTLEAAARKSAAKMLFQLDKISQKTARETMRRDERASQDAAYLMDLIYPHRHLQERFYSIVPFLAKHGLDLPERLLGMTQLACPDHMVRTLA
ncbi:MAG: bacillithiol biosynthesis cysteine-adding enzyme BshC [Acidobacteriaceae bacterium]|nr:bacillithiol biosynthesis cysteine-adding enzyme BshC [Acidobacteriaceae bacterium]